MLIRIYALEHCLYKKTSSNSVNLFMHLNTTSIKRWIKRAQPFHLSAFMGTSQRQPEAHRHSAQKERVHIVPVKAQGISCFALLITLVSVSVTDFTDQWFGCICHFFRLWFLQKQFNTQHSTEEQSCKQNFMFQRTP